MQYSGKSTATVYVSIFFFSFISSWFLFFFFLFSTFSYSFYWCIFHFNFIFIHSFAFVKITLVLCNPFHSEWLFFSRCWFCSFDTSVLFVLIECSFFCFFFSVSISFSFSFLLSVLLVYAFNRIGCDELYTRRRICMCFGCSMLLMVLQLVSCVRFKCIVSGSIVATNHSIRHIVVHKKCGRTKRWKMGKKRMRTTDLKVSL